MLQDEPAGGVSARQMPRAQAGSDLKGDTINQMVALYAFKANLQVIKVQDRMLGMPARHQNLSARSLGFFQGLNPGSPCPAAKRIAWVRPDTR